MATRKATPKTINATAQLRELRKSIDNLDAALICLLAERFRVTTQVGHLKAAHDIAALDPKREAAQGVRIRALANKSGLDPQFAEQILRFILKDVVRKHRAIAAG